MTKGRVLDFDPARGIPAGARIVYACDDCGDRVASMPAREASCGCGNIAVDFDAARVSIGRYDRMRAIEIDG
jgi:hypothetical protein